ncbi:gem family protein [Megaselia abdita]
MALSLVSSAHSSYSDLQSFFDNSRLGFDFSTTFHDQMEYNNLQNTHPQRNYSDGHQHVTANITKVFNDYDQVINFVDSPPNSKESWSEEQNSGSPRIIDVQTIYSNSGNRKRRMDWDPLDISHGANNNSNNNPRANNNSSPPKIPNITANSNTSSQNTQQSSGLTEQQRDRSNNNNDNKKKQSSGSGRGNWSDEIDFGEFDNSPYLNSEAFLSFNAPLGLKQEIPSPQTPSKLSKSPQGHIICSPDHGHTKTDQQDHNIPINASPNNKRFEGDNENGGGAFQQLLPSASAAENTSVQNSPRPIPESSAKSDLPADDFKFQYILAAATSIATKNNEETLTYLNQGQSYEIKLKKTGDLSFYRDKILRSVIKICFHERRLQYMERAQMQQWQASRPGERIIEVDVPLSYGLCSAYQPTNCNQSNTVEVFWDPMKEVGVYIKVNCISTEFTPKKHGGEKGVPFRIQIETYIENSVDGDNNNTGTFSTSTNNGNSNNGNNSSTNNNQSVNSNNKLAAIHAAACQIKVFKLKGADRKHKQDKEKIQRRPQSEQDKYQPSYECTILNDIPLDSLNSTPGCYSPEYFGKLWPNSPVHITKYDGLFQTVPTTSNSSPIAINCVTSTNTSNLKIMDCNMVSPQQIEIDECVSLSFF